jgi:hypothetical protein
MWIVKWISLGGDYIIRKFETKDEMNELTSRLSLIGKRFSWCFEAKGVNCDSENV